MLTVLPKATVPPPVIPVEVEMVMEEFTKSPLPTSPLYKLPDEEQTIPVPKELKVVEPLAAIWNKEIPDDDEIVNNGAAPGWPCKVKAEEVEVVPMDRR